MALNACPFCDHGNQAAAKYCSECGGCLHLLPCPNCGSVSDVSVSTCPQCKYVIPGRQVKAPELMPFAADVTKINETMVAAPQIPVAQPLGRHALTVPSPVIEASRPVATRNSRALIGLALLGGLAVLGYYGYQHRLLPDVFQLSPAGSASQGSGGVIRQDTTAVVPNKGDNTQITAPTTTTASETPAAGNEALARPTTAPNGAAAVATPLANTPATQAAGASERSTASDKCTDAALALGLCAPTPALPTVTHTERKE